MADEMDAQAVEDRIRSRPEIFLSHRFVIKAMMENPEDLADCIIPILRKSLGLNPMTVEEKAISDLFREESLIPDDD